VRESAAAMAAGFVFEHFLLLNKYLEKRCGAASETYERKTKKYVP
jgi:hypothetical protein